MRHKPGPFTPASWVQGCSHKRSRYEYTAILPFKQVPYLLLLAHWLLLWLPWLQVAATAATMLASLLWPLQQP
jgi:hypothetical protein